MYVIIMTQMKTGKCCRFLSPDGNNNETSILLSDERFWLCFPCSHLGCGARMYACLRENCIVLRRGSTPHMHKATGCILHNQRAPCANCISSDTVTLPCMSFSSYTLRNLAALEKRAEALLFLSDKSQKSTQAMNQYKALIRSSNSWRIICGTLCYVAGSGHKEHSDIQQDNVRIRRGPLLEKRYDDEEQLFYQLIADLHRLCRRLEKEHKLLSEVRVSDGRYMTLSIISRRKLKMYRNAVEADWRDREQSGIAAIDATGNVVKNIPLCGGIVHVRDFVLSPRAATDPTVPSHQRPPGSIIVRQISNELDAAGVSTVRSFNFQIHS
jgi:hypothetical protein